eukprot:625610-Heterocapsa_arctica.AAC.1
MFKHCVYAVKCDVCTTSLDIRPPPQVIQGTYPICMYPPMRAGLAGCVEEHPSLDQHKHRPGISGTHMSEARATL